MIAIRYAKKSFFWDLIAWIPFDLIIISSNRSAYAETDLYLLRFLKLFRVSRLFELLDVEKFKGLLGTYYEAQLKKAVQFENFSYHYPILQKVKYTYMYRTLQILVISIACSYFLGLFWRIFVTVMINWEGN